MRHTGVKRPDRQFPAILQRQIGRQCQEIADENQQSGDAKSEPVDLSKQWWRDRFGSGNSQPDRWFRWRWILAVPGAAFRRIPARRLLQIIVAHSRYLFLSKNEGGVVMECPPFVHS